MLGRPGFTRRSLGALGTAAPMLSPERARGAENRGAAAPPATARLRAARHRSPPPRIAPSATGRDERNGPHVVFVSHRAGCRDGARIHLGPACPLRWRGSHDAAACPSTSLRSVDGLRSLGPMDEQVAHSRSLTSGFAHGPAVREASYERAGGAPPPLWFTPGAYRRCHEHLSRPAAGSARRHPGGPIHPAGQTNRARGAVRRGRIAASVLAPRS